MERGLLGGPSWLPGLIFRFSLYSGRRCLFSIFLRFHNQQQRQLQRLRRRRSSLSASRSPHMHKRMSCITVIVISQSLPTHLGIVAPCKYRFFASLPTFLPPPPIATGRCRSNLLMRRGLVLHRLWRGCVGGSHGVPHSELTPAPPRYGY